MSKQVTRVDFSIPKQPKLEQVAAYCRVSRNGDAMLHSLSQQISYYSAMIQSHPGWVFCGVYADEAKTGTKDSRPKFMELLEECRKGMITLIITKSVSRFARNTVTLLETVRELKALDVDVFFEEQNIHTKSADGELMLSILASYAQEESRSVSDNQKWRIRKNFEEGKPWNGTILGYQYKDGQYIIQPEEAETVRRIFDLYLSGYGITAISQILKAEGRKTRKNHDTWSENGICKILRNDTYTGNLTLQKTFRDNHLSKQLCINHGEMPLYRVEESHEAIIPQELFDAVQTEISRRASLQKHLKKPVRNVFSGKLQCAICGKNYRRKAGSRCPMWQCCTYNKFGKSACASKQIPEDILMEVSAGVLGLPIFDERAFDEKVSGILVCPDNRLVYRMIDDTEYEVFWKDRSRKESWTPEKREAASKKRKENYHAESNSNTGHD